MSFAKIRPRRGTANQWSNANPILAEGEIGIEVPSTGVGTGTVKIKFGDGSSHWNDLPYGLDTPNDISDVISDEFIAGTPCTSGNYYIANNKLYKCIADTDGSINVTNSNYFEETSVTGEVKTLNGRLTQVQSQTAPMFNNAGAHNAIYRGKNLGTSVTTAQYNAIKAGTFDDLYIGDYWVINEKTWRIAAFDYYLRCGDTDLTTHHAVIVPDECLYNARMNTTNNTTGGYVAVKTRGVLTNADTVIKSTFGASHILSHRVYLTNAVANGKPSGGAWVDTICDLMNEEMVYGTGIFRHTSDGSTYLANHRVEKSQLPLFAHEPSRIINRANYWLRDVVTAAHFAAVDYGGFANYLIAPCSPVGVRPAFCIS